MRNTRSRVRVDWNTSPVAQGVEVDVLASKGLPAAYLREEHHLTKFFLDGLNRVTVHEGEPHTCRADLD